jgi:hypothetical protein
MRTFLGGCEAQSGYFSVLALKGAGFVAATCSCMCVSACGAGLLAPHVLISGLGQGQCLACSSKRGGAGAELGGLESAVVARPPGWTISVLGSAWPGASCLRALLDTQKFSPWPSAPPANVGTTTGALAGALAQRSMITYLRHSLVPG